MNRGRNTLILVIIGAALGAYIYFVEMKRQPASESPAETLAKVFEGVESSRIEEITVKSSGGDETTLRRQDDSWQIVAPVQAKADDSEASGIASSLSTLEVQRVIDEAPKDLGTFGLATPRFEVAFRVAGESEPRRLLVGDKTPTGGEMYAKLGNASRVFLISGYLDGTFDRSTFQLRDKRVLAFDREKVDRIEVHDGKSVVTVTKQDDAWRVTQPVAARADAGTVESVLSRVNGGQMKAIVSQEATPAELKKYGLDPAARRVVLAAGSTSASLLLGKESPEGDVYAKDASRPLVFTVEKSLADDLAKQVGDFRSKDVFGFRAFSGTRLEIVRGGTTYVFEKKKGTEENALERWTQTQPAKDVVEAKLDDLASKVGNLRAEGFVDPLPSGATEAARISTAFDEGKKQETVVIHQVGEDYYATREGDAGAAKLTASDVTAIFTVLEEAQKAEWKAQTQTK